MKIFVAGNWVDKPKKIEVKNPFEKLTPAILRGR